jgi:hypothetical protein
LDIIKWIQNIKQTGTGLTENALLDGLSTLNSWTAAIQENLSEKTDISSQDIAWMISRLKAVHVVSGLYEEDQGPSHENTLVKHMNGNTALITQYKTSCKNLDRVIMETTIMTARAAWDTIDVLNIDPKTLRAFTNNMLGYTELWTEANRYLADDIGKGDAAIILEGLEHPEIAILGKGRAEGYMKKVYSDLQDDISPMETAMGRKFAGQ